MWCYIFSDICKYYFFQNIQIFISFRSDQSEFAPEDQLVPKIPPLFIDKGEKTQKSSARGTLQRKDSMKSIAGFPSPYGTLKKEGIYGTLGRGTV